MTRRELKERHLNLKNSIELAMLDSDNHEDAIRKRKMDAIIWEWSLDDSGASHNFLVRMMG